jgi:hypothetical protein
MRKRCTGFEKWKHATGFSVASMYLQLVHHEGHEEHEGK